MASTTPASTIPAAIAIARDVVIRPPKRARGRRGRAWLHDETEVRLPTRVRGRQTRIREPNHSYVPSCVPESPRGADASPSSAQGVVQFLDQALRTGLHVRGVALPTFFRLVEVIRNVQGGEYGDLRGVDRRRALRHFFHAGIDETGQVMNVAALPVRTYAVRLTEDLDLSHASPFLQPRTPAPFKM